jgi:predicted metal-binding protein
MKKVAIIGCGAYMDAGYGCPGEWRCLKAANQGDGTFDEPHMVTAYIKCECPGRATMPTLGMAMKLSEIRPDVVHLSSCLANAQPGCPHFTADELAEIITAKTGLPVVKGTHDYH